MTVMSKSPEDREQNRGLALHLMLEHLPADRPYEWELVDGDVEPFSAVYPTTWRELTHRGLVKPFPFDRYLLTGNGWIEALQVTGELQSDALLEKAGRLSAALKNCVKATGRHADALVHRTKLSEETGLPWAWIYNAIDSLLLQHLFRQRGASWAPDDQMKDYILVPLEFGLPDD